MLKYPLQINSWTILSKYTFIKKMDKSAFLHHGTGIPKKIKQFWGVYELDHGDEKLIVVLYEGRSYKMKITCDQLKRTRLFWNADFSGVIAQRYNELFDLYKKDDVTDLKPEMRFTCTGTHAYRVEFIDIVEVDKSLGIFAERVDDYSYASQKEGKVIYQYSRRHERNPNLRTAAIRLHGLTCTACTFNFGSTYGRWGEGYIEIHHTKPLYENEREVEVDPRCDLVPVCSNCHAMIHKVRAKVLSIDQVKILIAHN